MEAAVEIEENIAESAPTKNILPDSNCFFHGDVGTIQLLWIAEFVDLVFNRQSGQRRFGI